MDAINPEAFLDGHGTTEQYQPSGSRARVSPNPSAALCSILNVKAWVDRDLPPPDRLLGDLITTTTRTFIVGSTGLGKTQLAMAIAAGVASGRGFLHWPSSRAGRVLYIDGEMPAELIKARATDAIRRAGGIPNPDNLVIFGRDAEDEVRRACPEIGPFAPVNTEDGQRFVHALIALLGGVDLVIFDNVMSLITGDQKDEIPWSETLPLIQSLTAKRIGQLWLDHAGHNGGRQYGSSTKAWRFDAVGLMEPIAQEDRSARELAFRLSFESPGKARRRTPMNWDEFDACTIRLAGDVWTTDARQASRRGKIAPKIRLFHDAMIDAIAAGNTVGPGKVTRACWINECVRRELIDTPEADDDALARSRKLSQFRKAASDLQAAGWIGASDGIFTDLTRRYGCPR